MREAECGGLQTGVEELAERISGGDTRAEEDFVARYSRGLMVMLVQRTQDRQLAEDVHQDTFALVLLKVRQGALRDPSALKGFLYSTARNLLIEHFRKRNRRQTSADTEMIERVRDEHAGPFEHISREEMAAHLRTLLAELRVPRDRQLLRDFFLHERDKSQICAELEITPAHFDRVKYRALQRLIELVRARGGRLQ